MENVSKKTWIKKSPEKSGKKKIKQKQITYYNDEQINE